MNAKEKAIAERKTQISDVMQVEAVKTQLMTLLGNNPQKLEKFRTRMLNMSQNSMLDGCTPLSLVQCGVQALTLNLPLEAGQGYVVKYGNVATLDPGFKGWQVLAKRCAISVLADPVYKCDHFEASGLGFDIEIDFRANVKDRKSADDNWVLENLTCVIVSIREDKTGLVQKRIVYRDMLDKIMGMSPGASSKFSPYKNWLEQMMLGKAIKQVLTKFPIDVEDASQLTEAIRIVNETESAQQQAPAGPPEYGDNKFETNYPKWLARVRTGQNPARQIISSLTNSYTFTDEQQERLYDLVKEEPKEPIEGELVDGEPEQ